MEKDDTVKNLHKSLEPTKHNASKGSFARDRSKNISKYWDKDKGTQCFRYHEWGHMADKCLSKVMTVTISERIQEEEDGQKYWFVTG